MFQTGTIGKKGTLGSPYAVSDTFVLDQALDEPVLGLPLEVQALAMVEAFHSVGIKIVIELVLRTASIDSVLVDEHPEWFYWVREDEYRVGVLKPPTFSVEQLDQIHQQVSRHDHTALPEPDLTYRAMFCQPPKQVVKDNNGWLGYSHSGERLRIPGAFADWPPDDTQPLWSDVTYFKLHNHPDLAYAAYNTLRMFDERLEHEEYEQKDLWNTLQEVIPHWIRMLGIDGVLIDMGHALPLKLRHAILQKARGHHKNLLIYEERFEIEEDMRLQGIDAVMGYLPQAARRFSELREFTSRSERGELPLSFFATVESHNTPRITRDQDEQTSYAIWRYVSLLPRGLPFIVSGFDIGETYPINTGLGFMLDEVREYNDRGLPLFDDVRLEWQRSNRITAALQKRCFEVCHEQIYQLLSDDDDVALVAQVDNACLVYTRLPRQSERGLIVALNISSQDLLISIAKNAIVDIAAHDSVVRRDDSFILSIGAGSCLVLPMLVRRH